MVQLLFLVAAFFAECALAEDTPATDAPAGKEQPPITVLSAHIEVSRLGYTRFEMEVRANQKIAGWDVVTDWGKIGTSMGLLEKGQTRHWSTDLDKTEPIKKKVMTCKVTGVRLPPTGVPLHSHLIRLDSPITFEATVVEKPVVKLDMSRLKDARVRTTADVTAFFEKDGTGKAGENRVYTLKELRAALGKPKDVNESTSGSLPYIPPELMHKVDEAFLVANTTITSRNLFIDYECRDGVITVELRQHVHDNNLKDVDDNTNLQIHAWRTTPPGTRGHGDTGTRGHGDTGTRGQGDKGTRGQEGRDKTGQNYLFRVIK